MMFSCLSWWEQPSPRPRRWPRPTSRQWTSTASSSRSRRRSSFSGQTFSNFKDFFSFILTTYYCILKLLVGTTRRRLVSLSTPSGAWTELLSTMPWVWSSPSWPASRLVQSGYVCLCQLQYSILQCSGHCTVTSLSQKKSSFRVITWNVAGKSWYYAEYFM